MSGPIKPSEVSKRKRARIPDAVFDVFNDLIAEHWDDDAGEAVVLMKEAAAAIVARIPNMTMNKLFETNWLDVEAAYRAKGWQVAYDKPGYCETYDAKYTFAKRSRR